MANSESFPTEINKQLADLEGEKKEKENAIDRLVERRQDLENGLGSCALEKREGLQASISGTQSDIDRLDRGIERAHDSMTTLCKSRSCFFFFFFFYFFFFFSFLFFFLFQKLLFCTTTVTACLQLQPQSKILPLSSLPYTPLQKLDDMEDDSSGSHATSSLLPLSWSYQSDPSSLDSATHSIQRNFYSSSPAVSTTSSSSEGKPLTEQQVQNRQLQRQENQQLQLQQHHETHQAHQELRTMSKRHKEERTELRQQHKRNRRPTSSTPSPSPTPQEGASGGIGTLSSMLDAMQESVRPLRPLVVQPKDHLEGQLPPLRPSFYLGDQQESSVRASSSSPYLPIAPLKEKGEERSRGDKREATEHLPHDTRFQIPEQEEQLPAQSSADLLEYLKRLGKPSSTPPSEACSNCGSRDLSDRRKNLVGESVCGACIFDVQGDENVGSELFEPLPLRKRHKGAMNEGGLYFLFFYFFPLSFFLFWFDCFVVFNVATESAAFESSRPLLQASAVHSDYDRLQRSSQLIRETKQSLDPHLGAFLPSLSPRKSFFESPEEENTLDSSPPIVSNQSERRCDNCKTDQTPNWRRASTGALLCNACGLYFRFHGSRRPENQKIKVPRKKKKLDFGVGGGPKVCKNCGTTTTCAWRRGVEGEYLCNACGLHQMIHHTHRPSTFYEKTNLNESKGDPK